LKFKVGQGSRIFGSKLHQHLNAIRQGSLLDGGRDLERMCLGMI
jgi:hypothetical protein